MLVGKRRDWLEGEQRAWDILCELSPQDVSRRAKAVYDELFGRYVLPLFNEEISVSPKDRQIRGNSLAADFLLNKFHYYSRLSILWYLIQSKDVPLSGNLVNPSHMSGGLMFERGSHILPLDKIAKKYSSDVQGFLKRGVKFGGDQLDFGDASFRLYPFPRVPVVLLLWKSDEEFPAHADLLFDSTCSIHLPMDIIWSTAMMSILIML